MAEKTNIKKCKKLVANLKKKVYFKSALVAYNKKYSQIVQELIAVGEDKQKPDSDVLIYSESNNTPIINFSCKTSCRERAGQTYKWKLLSDLACCNCEHKYNNENCPITKYGLHYEPKRKIFMYFITADFYNELSNPQIAAMFNFFDNSYVAKSYTSSEKIKTLEHVIDDINTIY